MAAPNIINTTTITGKITANTVTTIMANLISNAPDSSQVYKVNTVAVTNANTLPILCNLSLLRAATTYYLASNITIPVGTTVLLIAKDNGIYLEEGDALQTSAQTDGLHVSTSYEVIG